MARVVERAGRRFVPVPIYPHLLVSGRLLDFKLAVLLRLAGLDSDQYITTRIRNMGPAHSSTCGGAHSISGEHACPQLAFDLPMPCHRGMGERSFADQQQMSLAKCVRVCQCACVPSVCLCCECVCISAPMCACVHCVRVCTPLYMRECVFLERL